MNALRRFIRREPASLVAVVLAALNLIGVNFTDVQEEEVRSIIESVLVLVGGATVRQAVTPTSKIGPGKGPTR